VKGLVERVQRFTNFVENGKYDAQTIDSFLLHQINLLLTTHWSFFLCKHEAKGFDFSQMMGEYSVDLKSIHQNFLSFLSKFPSQ